MAGSGFDMNQLGGGMLGMGLGQMMGGWKNPADSGMGYLDQMPDAIRKYMDYYTQGGMDAGGRLNDIGSKYKQSPGYQFAMDQAMQGGNHAAAAGGMAGSPQHEQQNMMMAGDIASQDYNNWMKNALGIYDTGAKSGMQEGEDMASILANKAKMGYEGQNAENQHNGGMWGSMLGGLGTMLGGPLGGGLGKIIGGFF